MKRSLSFLSALLLVACAPSSSLDATTKGDAEEGAPIDGAFDSFASPTDRGELTLGEAADGELTRREQYLAWTFTLDADADVTLRTEPAAGGRSVDTVLYLYREGARGWGRYIARNDDAGGTLFSSISRRLGAGRYRALVKGYDSRVRGPFVLASECAGEGCPTPPVMCLFGATYRELLASTAFEGELSTRVTPGVTVTPERAAQIVRAVQVTYTDVTDLASALAAVDGDEVNVTVLRHRVSAERFTAIEYGAGDNSYGAILRGESTRVEAEIRDGDLYACTFTVIADGSLEGELCHTGECATGLFCAGMDPVEGIGRCAPEGRVEGEGASCTHALACPSEQLVCAGLSRGDEGICVQRWMQGSFSNPGPWSIPDGDPNGLAVELTARGLATVDMDVWMSGLVNHPSPEQLLITLTNPATSEAVIFDGARETADAGYLELDNVVARYSGDESVNGVWTLRVVDRVSGGVGTLERWSLTITSRWD